MTFPFTLLVAVELITLHMIDGRVVRINPQQVTQLLTGAPAGDHNKVMHDAVNCIVRLGDGTFASVVETCDEIRRLMMGGTK